MWAAGYAAGYEYGFGDGYGLAMRLMAAEWFHRAPCGCGSDGCYVLSGDGENPPPEIHVGAVA